MKSEGIEEFYKRKLGWVPDDFHHQIGHFNVFKLDPFVGKNAQPVPYVRRRFYKVMLVIGNGKVHYADKTIDVNGYALSFSNPQIPYKWENTDQIKSGFFCIFDDAFFQQFGNISQYSVFHPQGNHIFELSEELVEKITGIYKQMFIEINTNYVHKYDVLRMLVFELIHLVMKLQPSIELDGKDSPGNASKRISNLFLELLERQFPIDEHHATIHFRTPSEFAKQLNIHVNHLNRAIKETTEKSTSQIIADRILHEAKILLKQSDWNISEIAYVLGFSEATHFSNFFKKHTLQTPTNFRSI